MENKENKDNNKIFKELIDRFKSPWNKTSFVLYFVIVIVVLSGLGYLLPIIFHKTNVMQDVTENLMTYSISLLVPAFISVLLKYYPKSKNKVSLIIITVFLLVVEGFIISYSYHGWLFFSIVSTVIALFFWVVANADNVFLDDEAYDENINKNVNELGKQWNNQK